MLECLKLCLTENHFEFNGSFFTQIHGTSIGPKMAPGYACLGMGIFEEELWQKCSFSPTVWFRCIDDIWGLRSHGPDLFKEFMKTLNNLYPGELEFTSCFNYDSLPFLDLRIFRNSEGFLNTDLFVKPTFKSLYFNYNSYHSKHVLDNIAYGQALRIRTICSTEESAHKNLNTLRVI